MMKKVNRIPINRAFNDDLGTDDCVLDDLDDFESGDVG
jgi:hypothetical protein